MNKVLFVFEMVAPLVEDAVCKIVVRDIVLSTKAQSNFQVISHFSLTFPLLKLDNPSRPSYVIN